MAVWSELWNSILQARLDQMGWNLKWFIFELFLTEIVNDFLIKTANFKMWFYAVSKMLHLTLTLCLSLASQQMAFFPICILPCLCPKLTTTNILNLYFFTGDQPVFPFYNSWMFWTLKMLWKKSGWKCFWKEEENKQSRLTKTDDIYDVYLQFYSHS